MATTEEATATAHSFRNRGIRLSLMPDETYIEMPVVDSGESIISVTLGLSEGSTRYDSRTRLDPEIRGTVQRFEYNQLGDRAPTWRETGGGGSSYRVRVAEICPERIFNHEYRIFDREGRATYLIRQGAGVMTLIAEAGSTNRESRGVPRAYIGEIPIGQIWLEVASPASAGIPADPALSSESEEAGQYHGNHAAITANALKDDNGAIWLNPALVIGKPYIFWMGGADEVPYFGTWVGEDDGHFCYYARNRTYFIEDGGYTSLATHWVEQATEAEPARRVAPAQPERLDTLLAREEYEFELLWTTTHRLARREDWCGSYDQIVSAQPIGMPERNRQNLNKTMPEWDEWLEARNTAVEQESEPETNQYMIDVSVRANVYWSSAPTSFDRWLTEHVEDSPIESVTVYRTTMENVSMAMEEVAVGGEWTEAQATMDDTEFREAVGEAVTAAISDTSLYVEEVLSMESYNQRIRVNENI